MSHSTDREPIGVIGTGYVGLVTAAGFAELGNDVWCIDIDEAKIEGLKQGRMPIWEPGLEELVERHRDRLHFSTDLSDALEHARLLFVAVGTPPTYSGDADLSAVHAVVDAMPPSDRHALVMKSTVPGRHRRDDQARCSRSRARPASATSPARSSSRRARRSRTSSSPTASSSATTATGPATPSWSSTRRSNAPLVRTDIKSAEMVKLASNAFLATKISFINEIANVCEETGADVVEVARGMGLDDRIGPKFLQAGIGFGGSCFPKDVTALKQLAGNSGYHFQLLNSVIEVNELQKRRVMAKLAEAPRLAGRQGDRAARPGLQAQHRRHARGVLARALRTAAGRGRAGARLRPGRRGGGAQAAARRRVPRVGGGAPSDGADAVVLVTEWPEFAELDLAAVAASMRGNLIIDGRNFLDPAQVRAAGLDYEGVGPPQPARNGTDAGADPRRRRRHPPAPPHHDLPQARRAAGRPARSSASCSTGCARTASTR